ncbi:MAG: protein phosphatase 2C domain-containing protein, partial [Oscillospiraceae bacterium]|nr:protein phosphatase 2C domain-containing protein [Oscillospiraceae bacterium]
APAKPAEEKHLSDREVMEHTASIWQYKSITDDGTEQHSEYHEKRIKAPFAEIIGARVRGKKHKHDGTNCDDYFETALTEDCAISVVCDGAGSRVLSRIGSRVCSETAASYLKTSLSELFKKEANLKAKLSADISAPEFMEGCGKIAALVRDSAREAFTAQQNELKKLAEDEIYAKALGRPAAISDLSTTFLAAVVVPLEINGARQALTVSVQIGDGCICTIDSKAGSESCLRLIGEADSGKFSGETDFISEKNIVPDVIGGKTRVGRSTADIIMLMTDGVADDYFPAQPMMKRLYLDLCLNGILPMAGELTAGEDPAPIRYRSVSMSQQSVALQYAKQLLNPNDPNAMNALWDKREVLRCHSLEAFRMNIGDSPEERLRVWLDNYNERGSFDDRAITVIRLPRDEKDCI